MSSASKLKTALFLTAAFAVTTIAHARPKADLNNDGQVTQAEFMTAATTRFVTADTNADGILTKDERKSARHAKRELRASKRFAAIDANGDGFISKDEYEAKRAERHGKMKAKRDINGDGVVDELDREARRAKREARRAKREASGKKGAHKRRANLDTNNDGVVTRAEYEVGTLAMFERLDVNGDGVLTKGEARKRGKRKHRRRGH